MKLPKLTMKGTLASASRTRHADGAANTGFAPLMNRVWILGCGARACSANERTEIDSGSIPLAEDPSDALIGSPGEKNRPPGRPTLPKSSLSAFTASAVDNPFVCASGAPPATATPEPAAASSRAILVIVSGETPVFHATACGE